MALELTKETVEEIRLAIAGKVTPLREERIALANECAQLQLDYQTKRARIAEIDNALQRWEKGARAADDALLALFDETP